MAVPYTIIIGSDGKIKNIVVGNAQGYGGLKKLVEGLNVTWDKTPPQISEINLSTSSIISWKTDKETHSSLQGIQDDGKVTGWDVTEDWTTYHRVDITSMKAYGYDKIKIISMDYCGNTASAVITSNPAPAYDDDLSFSVEVNDDGSLSYPEENTIKIHFVKGGTKKYVCSGIISNGMHNIITVEWDVFLVSCPDGGEHFVFAAADQVDVEGGDARIVRIPISIDGNAPNGLYQFKILFYGL
jgi:hypothetical protein